MDHSLLVKEEIITLFFRKSSHFFFSGLRTSLGEVRFPSALDNFLPGLQQVDIRFYGKQDAMERKLRRRDCGLIVNVEE